MPTADGQGRCVAAEVLVPTPGVRNLIREGKTHQIYSLIQTGGPARHADDGRLARRPGPRATITMAVAESRSSEPAELRKLVADSPARRRHLGSAPPDGRLMAAATFTYKAVDVSGIPSKGEIAGASKQAVTDELKARGLDGHGPGGEEDRPQRELTLIQARQGGRADGHDPPAGDDDLLGHDAPARVLRARGADREQEAQGDLGAVREDIEAGLSFSEALAKHPKIFNPLYVAMVRAGEAGGVLEESLERVADQLEKDDSLRRQVKSAMAYPAVVLTFAIVVLLALIAFIVPVFVGVFKDFGGELPLITKFTVACRTLVTGQWYLLIAARVGVVVGFTKWRKSAWGRPQWDRFRLRIPFKIGDTVQKIALARWSRTFSALYSAGVPIMQAIEVTGQTAGNAVVEEAMDDVIESVKSGGSIADAARGRADLPGDGRPDDRRRRGDGQPRHHAHQGRGLLRGRGRRGRQGPDLDPRAGHDRARGRHRRLHRDRDVHADVQGLRRDQVAQAP